MPPINPYVYIQLIASEDEGSGESASALLRLISVTNKTKCFCKQAVDKGCQWRSHVAQRLSVQEGVRFAPSLAAALLGSLSEQPAGYLDSVSHREARPV